MLFKLRQFLANRLVIREQDPAGRLAAAGFEWSEPVPNIFAIFGSLAFVGFYFWIRSLFDAEASRDFKFLLYMASCVSLFICGQFGEVRRGVSFERNGSVRARGGWVNWLSMLGGIQDHAEITSIEIKKVQHAWAVAIYTNWGGTTILSTRLTEGNARVAAVQLTIALREMRESLTAVENFQQPGFPAMHQQLIS